MRAFISIQHKALTIWNGVRMDLQGDCGQLDNLIKELKEVRKEVNSEVNRKGLKLKDVEVKIELKNHPRS